MKRRTTTSAQRLRQATRTMVAAAAVAIALAACTAGRSDESGESGDSGAEDAVREACDYFRAEVIDREIDPEVGYEQLFDEFEGDLQHMQAFAYARSDPYLFTAVQNAISQIIVTRAAADWAHTQEAIEGARERGALIPSNARNLDEALEGLDAAGDNLDRAIEDVDLACERAGH